MSIFYQRLAKIISCPMVRYCLASKQPALILLFCTATVFTNSAVGSPTPLLLNNSDIRYDVNSAPQASGFFICPERQGDIDTVQLQKLKNNSLITTHPDFEKNNHYCFFINIINQTDQPGWELHFSNFFIDKVEVLLSDKSSWHEYQSDRPTSSSYEKINVLGRAFPLQLEHNKQYLLVLELTADGIVAPPYIALMSEPHYQAWSDTMSYVYNLSTGIIVGLILVALLCGALLKDITFFWFGISSLLLFSFFAIRSHLGFFVFHQTHGLPSWIWLWGSAITLSILLFARSFLLPEPAKNPVKNVFDLCIAYFLIVALLSLFLPKSWNLVIYSLNGIIMMIVIFYTGMVRVIESGRYYLIFMLGWVPVLFSLLEHIAIVVVEPASGFSTLSYKILREPFYQITHMLIHFVAMFIRIDALKNEKYQAEMRNEAKSRFLASVSHDLRQPLHSMGMFLAHLEDHVSTKSGQNVLAKVYGLHSAMNDSFKKLMDLSRLEAGAVKLNNESIDLGRLIAKMRLEFEPHAYAGGLRISFKSTAKYFNSDPALFERILGNLITNAIKYTDQGGVLVGFRTRKNHLLIQIWDTGRGISAVDQRVIFDIYERSEKISASHKGMGIGLAIVKQLVEFLGGEIIVKSEEGKGTQFQITLPCINNQSPTPRSQIDKNIKAGLSIILDLPNSQMLQQVSASLKNWGYLTAGESQAEGAASLTLIIIEGSEPLTAKSMSEKVDSFEKRYGNVVIAMFCNVPDRELASKLTLLNVHMLSFHYRPAQLRSLIRYLESSLLKIR